MKIKQKNENRFTVFDGKNYMSIELDWWNKTTEVDAFDEEGKDLTKEASRILWDAVVAEFPEVFEDFAKSPKMHTSYKEDSDESTNWFVLPASTSKEYLEKVLNRFGVAMYLINEPTEWHDVPAGAKYSDNPELIKQGSRILFKQTSYMNI